MKDIPEDIIVRAANGDLRAFEEIYRLSCGFVFSVALRVTNNHADAQEVTQDVFLKIHRKLKGFRFLSSFKTWIYRVTVNTAINKYKSAVKQTAKRVDFDSVINVTAARDIMEESIDKEYAQAAVSGLLEMLNPDQRACLVLREVHGLSYAEISEAMKININTVRSRLKRARLALMEHKKKR